MIRLTVREACSQMAGECLVNCLICSWKLCIWQSDLTQVQQENWERMVSNDQLYSCQVTMLPHNAAKY